MRKIIENLKKYLVETKKQHIYIEISILNIHMDIHIEIKVRSLIYCTFLFNFCNFNYFTKLNKFGFVGKPLLRGIFLYSFCLKKKK